MARRRRTWLVVVLLSALCAGALGAWWAYRQVGRTPAELIDYAQRRLQGHPRLEVVALPALEAVRAWLGEPDRLEQSLPFHVPPLPPASMAVAAGPRESGDPLRVLVGPARAITSLALAAQVAPEGAVIEVDPGDYLGDVTVWLQRKLSIKGMGPGVRLIAGGRSAESKAIWVIRRGNYLVENIEFIGARVPDRNGAGIRFEGGDLVVRRCRFYGNENGILGGGGEESSLVVEFSEFAYNGAGDGQSHGIYVGVDSLRLTGNYFHHSNVGHLVKSRSRHNRIEYNRLTDESGGRASYELEFPDGGVAEVVGNIIQQGSGTLNSVIVSIGAEAYRWPVNRLLMAHNTVVNDRRHGGTFVSVAPGAQSVVLRNNLWVGPGRVHVPADADTQGNHHVQWDAFALAAREDYRLADDARAKLGANAPAALPEPLRPSFEYQHPRTLAPLTAGSALPGALQSVPR